MIPVASTRKRAKSYAIIAALGAICGLDMARYVAVAPRDTSPGARYLDIEV